jgi:hypothetical protein
MDYTGFWNVAPTATVSLLILGMAWFTVTNFAHARLAALRTAQHNTVRYLAEMPEKVAA